jgi:lipopolysaccharide/colanic/teichoic acid biosynthesis glycosyltransferase
MASIYQKFWKRVFDIFFALLILVILSPVILLIMVIQILIYKGDIFYIQNRNTLGEKEFGLIKFTTMTDKKDALGNLLPDPDRLTIFGRVLRRTSFDEIPNLLNVIVGDLSFVGPRPLPTKFLPLMSQSQKIRYKVKSGITGLAQINGRNDLTWKEKFELDAIYVHNQTFINDLRILFRTTFIFFKKSINKDLNSNGIDNYKPDFNF